jgi:hypothetical protein
MDLLDLLPKRRYGEYVALASDIDAIPAGTDGDDE